ncbi:MAG: TRAP transporter permease [Betaproteobacteria bacterium]|nr:TRAP transporter permease [Betaproteobacteria bacterium]
MRRDGSDSAAAEELAAADVGVRAPAGARARAVLWWTPLLWSLFQLWIASPLPFILHFGVINDTRTRAIHLAFAIFLAYLAYPTLARGPRNWIPARDWAAAIIGAGGAAYICLFYEDIARRSGAPNTVDLIAAGIGVVFLLEAARRSLGAPLMLVALFFLGYVFFGSAEILPDIVRWKGASFEKAMSHLWLTTEGVFGVALGVSSGFVFLFVLFGSLLNQAGAGNYFVQIAFSLLGHLCGGPAKAAVVSSAMTGLVSGSSIANVVTTGTFTIPLMKKVGFSPEKAGAIEVSSSVNGVLTPPVMGAVAFLMTEYVGIPYVDVVKHAIIPAAISYIALIYIVHLEAKRSGMQSLPRAEPPPPWKMRLLSGGIAWASIFIIAGAAYHLIEFIKSFVGGAVLPVAVLTLAAYVALVRLSARSPDIELPGASLPIFRNVVYTGLYYVMPILVLVWFLVVEWKSPAFSAFGAILFLAVVLLTQKPLKAFFRRAPGWKAAAREGAVDLCEGLVAGARNMTGLAAAMGVAGIIVGAVTLTGVGQVMAEFVEFLSGGNLLAMLFFVALISIVLGMGLPTTANYIVVSSLMAGVVVELGAQSGFVVPLVAVHMFCFYYGIMADVTPPVGLASFAAAAISGGDPIKTGFTAFFYSLRTALLPFLFIFNTDLLLIDVSPAGAVAVFFIALTAMLAFAAGTMGWFITRSRWWESGCLLLAAFILFRPGFFLDYLAPPYERMPAAAIFAEAKAAPPGGRLRANLRGESVDGKQIDSLYLLPLGGAGEGAERLRLAAGLELRTEDGKIIVDAVAFGKPAEQMGVDFEWEVAAVEKAAQRPPKELFYIPAFMLLAAAAFSQRRRKNGESESAPGPA